MAVMALAKHFSDEVDNKARLIQCWVILVGKARNRQTITYAQLANLMRGDIKPPLGKRAGQWKGMRLGQLLNYCKERDLPLLPVIVITKKAIDSADKALRGSPTWRAGGRLPAAFVGRVSGKAVALEKTGLPADLAPYNPPDPNAERERVFGFDWYGLHPPIESDLKD